MGKPLEIVVATRNEGKFREMEAILGDLSLRLLSLADFPEAPEVAEDGDTFAANALQKARAIAAYTGRWAVADDSGLEVDALNGRPGVYSARWGGLETDAQRNALLLKRLQGVPMEARTARFRCVIALAAPDGTAETMEGTCEGQIAVAPRGTHGFGFDPVFYLPERGRTMAELPLEEKNRISHRARALAALRERLQGQAGEMRAGKLEEPS